MKNEWMTWVTLPLTIATIVTISHGVTVRSALHWLEDTNVDVFQNRPQFSAKFLETFILIIATFPLKKSIPARHPSKIFANNRVNNKLPVLLPIYRITVRNYQCYCLFTELR